jgi:hypothetical protein
MLQMGLYPALCFPWETVLVDIVRHIPTHLRGFGAFGWVWGVQGVLPALTKELPRAKYKRGVIFPKETADIFGHIGTDSRGLGILGGPEGTGGITIAQKRIARSESLRQSDVSPRKQPAASCPRSSWDKGPGLLPRS